MMESRTTSRATFSQRCRILSVAAHVVRDRATRNGDDFEGWRLSRLMREADTDAQVNFAEQKYNDWRQINRVRSAVPAPVAGTFAPHGS